MKRDNQSEGGQGLPFRVKGQRPLWGLGQRQLSRQTSISNTLNKGAGSEASLP